LGQSSLPATDLCAEEGFSVTLSLNEEPAGDGGRVQGKPCCCMLHGAGGSAGVE